MRIVCWFSCGAASAVATKLAIAENNGKLPLIIAYTEVIEEHSDNKRFLKNCENWFGQEIQILRNDFYEGSIYKVFEKNYIRTPKGAPCTRALKKQVRQRFEEKTDRQVFGYTAEEQARLDRFIDANNDVNIWTPLIDKGLSKEDCLAMLENVNIKLPEMYRLGYHNNNCIGCVKGGMGYWNKIKITFFIIKMFCVIILLLDFIY
jgi:3'-phosphoadenosine 5'-phosphosulfate sulfotransferase (PAPS reductase)/FAD synthetase